MIPQLLEANFGPGGATCEIVTTGFDEADVETARAIVQALAQQNDGERLADVDLRETLNRLGIPLKSPAQMQAEMMKVAEEIPAKPLALVDLGEMYDQEAEEDDVETSGGKYRATLDRLWKGGKS